MAAEHRDGAPPTIVEQLQAQLAARDTQVEQLGLEIAKMAIRSDLAANHAVGEEHWQDGVGGTECVPSSAADVGSLQEQLARSCRDNRQLALKLAQRERELAHALGLRRKLADASRTIARLQAGLRAREEDGVSAAAAGAAPAAAGGRPDGTLGTAAQIDELLRQLEAERDRADAAGANTHCHLAFALPSCRHRAFLHHLMAGVAEIAKNDALLQVSALIEKLAALHTGSPTIKGVAQEPGAPGDADSQTVAGMSSQEGPAENIGVNRCALGISAAMSAWTAGPMAQSTLHSADVSPATMKQQQQEEEGGGAFTVEGGDSYGALDEAVHAAAAAKQQWVQARRKASQQHRLECMHRGCVMQKFAFGKAKVQARFVKLMPGGGGVLWGGTSAQKLKSVPLASIRDVMYGWRTDTFQRRHCEGLVDVPEWHCFSLLLSDRTMDFAAPTDGEALTWTLGLRLLCWNSGAWPQAQTLGFGAVLWRRARLRLHAQAVLDEANGTDGSCTVSTQHRLQVAPHPVRITRRKLLMLRQSLCLGLEQARAASWLHEQGATGHTSANQASSHQQQYQQYQQQLLSSDDAAAVAATAHREQTAARVVRMRYLCSACGGGSGGKSSSSPS
jgi:hypothetical protein|eukprot:COSAG01_NODE_947_length_12532_cov_15.427388_11_plen_618_part_00